MAMTEHDVICYNLRAELDALKAAGKDSSDKGSEYMVKLYQLRDACAARLVSSGLAIVHL